MSRTVPVIGIAGYSVPASWGVWDGVQACLIPHSYVEAIRAAGGRPIVLPPSAVDPDAADLLDGLVFSGGPDVHPGLYGEASVHPRTRAQPERDTAELALLRRGLSLGLPILAVCRGMQLLAVAYGGRLHQHLPDVLGSARHQPRPGTYGQPEASFRPGSLAAGLLGERLRLKCHHHQGVADPGRLLVTGRGADGVPEAVEDPRRPFVLGVQWHPEETEDRRLFRGLTGACAAMPLTA